MSYKYKPRSEAQIRFHLLKGAIGDRAYVTVLDVLANAIEAAIAEIEQAKKNELPDEILDGVVEDETQIIESLLGVAFVVCQIQITAVTKAALDCRAAAEREGLPLPPFGKKEFDVWNFGSTVAGYHSKIEVLWQLANYFKHRDAWSSETWTNPDGLAKYTIPVITAIGLEQGSNGNLRTGAEALGNGDYATMKIFEDIISDWANQVREAIGRTLGL
jgi:hypothetical protein